MSVKRASRTDDRVTVMRPVTRSFYLEAIQRVIAQIAVHLDEALDLERLASDACLSPFHFHRVFRGMVGETPMEFVRRLRLERAAWQLVETDQTVTAIAFDAGYDAHEAFTRSFRAHFDASPTEFRARARRRYELAAPCGVHFDPGGQVPQFIPRDSGGRDMKVDIKEMPELRLATLRHLGPYNQIGAAFERLGRQLGPAAGPLFQRGAQMIALYHDNPESVSPSELRSDAAISVPAGADMPQGFAEQRIRAGRYAAALHVGGYELLGDAWTRFMGEWLPASGERAAVGACFEIYLNDPTTTPKDQLRTEMYAPLA